MSEIKSGHIPESAVAVGPLSLTVDVLGDHVVVSGSGVVATFKWRDSDRSAVKRFVAQPVGNRSGESGDRAFRVVLDDVPPLAVAEQLTREQADELSQRITDALSLQLGLEPDRVDDEVPNPQPMTLKDLAVAAACTLACLVLVPILFLGLLAGVYYLLKSFGFDEAANGLANLGVIGAVVYLIVVLIILPFVVAGKVMTAIQGGDRS